MRNIKTRAILISGFAVTLLLAGATVVYAQSPSSGFRSTTNYDMTPSTTTTIVTTTTSQTTDNSSTAATATPGTSSVVSTSSMSPSTTTAVTTTRTSASATPDINVSSSRELLLLATSEDMTLGKAGISVSALQGFLAELGFLDLSRVGGPTGYFGPMTKNALARYQAAIGVTPAVGYFGPITRTMMALHFARNSWLASATPGATATATASTRTSGTGGIDAKADLPGLFSYQNVGSWYNGAWYPNVVK